MNTYLDQLCERCGSKRKVARTWKEKIPTFSGTTMVEYSQIVCTNKKCQEESEKEQLKDSQKRAEIRDKKEANDIIRKANALQHAKSARKKV